VCCDAADVCCWGFDGGGGVYYYCSSPCIDAVSDSESCSEDIEEDYTCNGCKQILPPTCATYRDYSGLLKRSCYYGCPYDWDTSDEICFEVKECFGILKDGLCFDCEGQERCWPVEDVGGGTCETTGQCVVQIACNLITMCFECSPIETVVEVVTEETCECAE
jgi:hypothetical protein